MKNENENAKFKKRQMTSRLLGKQAEVNDMHAATMFCKTQSLLSSYACLPLSCYMLYREKSALAQELLQKSVELQDLKAGRGIWAEASDASQQVLPSDIL